MKYRLSSVSAILGIVAIAMSACSSTSIATDWHTGEALVIRVKEIRLAEDVRYSHEGKHYLIQPTQEGQTMAVALLELRSRGANVAYLSVNKDAVRLRDDKFLDYPAINPFEERSEVDEAGPREDTVVPFIWGDVELPQRCGEPEFCELKGWVLFEVPSDIKFNLLIWDTGDTIFLRF